jgi:hypothetical protein
MNTKFYSRRDGKTDGSLIHVNSPIPSLSYITRAYEPEFVQLE